MLVLCKKQNNWTTACEMLILNYVDQPTTWAIARHLLMTREAFASGPLHLLPLRLRFTAMHGLHLEKSPYSRMG